MDDDCYELIEGSVTESYIEIEFTETVTLCFSDNCDPGTQKTEQDQRDAGSGEETCSMYEMIPIEDPDPELCPCPCEDGVCSVPGLQSVKFKIAIGRGFDYQPPLNIRLHEEFLSANSYTPAALYVPNEKGARIYRNPDYTIRQVRSLNTLADVVTVSDSEFRVDLYEVEWDQEFEKDEKGFLIPVGETYQTFTFSNPTPGTFDHYSVVQNSGAGKREHRFVHDKATDNWSLQTGSNDPVEESVLRTYDEDKKLLISTRANTDTKTGQKFETIRHIKDFDFGRRLIKKKKRLGDQLVTSERIDYYGEDAPAATRGKMSAKVNELTGTWVKYDYDESGRVSRKILPWKDSPFGAPANECLVEEYRFSSVPRSSEFFNPYAEMVRIQKKIQGVLVSTTYRVRSADPVDGGLIKLEEQTSQPQAPFGDLANARTVTRYFPMREADPASGKIRSIRYPDGKLVSTSYESGDYTGIEGVPGDFTPRVGGYFTRVTEIEATEEHPNGFPQKTVATVSVLSPAQKELLVESRIRQEGDEEFSEVIDWKGYSYTPKGLKRLERDATGIFGEYRYNPCCGKLEWHRDANGTVTEYLRDDEDRVTSRIVTVPGLTPLETHYTYDFLGNITSELVASGKLELETTREYDEKSRIISSTTPEGLTTRYQYDEKNHRTVTINPDNTTRVEDRYLDGQLKAVHGTSIVAQYFDHGVEATTGSRWSETTVAKAEGPRWNRTFTNPLNRTFFTEAPGHGDNVILASMNMYDEKGRITSTATGWKTMSAVGGADDEKDGEITLIGAPTLYTYHPETGEILDSGQDVDRNQKLEPGGVDKINRTETLFEKEGAHWYQVTRSYTFPEEKDGKPWLVNEARRRITGLGTPSANPDDIPGVLVSETTVITPGDALDTPLKTISMGYRDRETGQVTTVTTSPTGVESRQIALGSQIQATIECKHGEDGEIHTCCETTYEYDTFGRRIATIDPRTGKTTTEYDPETGRVVAQIDAEGRRNELEYYPADHKYAGKLKSTTNPDGKKQLVAYNQRGQQTGVWGDTTQPIAYRYNEYGELVEMQTFQTLPNGDPSTEANQGAPTRWHYHEATGTLLSKTYADGKGPQYQYTQAGQLKTRLWARENNESSRKKSQNLAATTPQSPSQSSPLPLGEAAAQQPQSPTAKTISVNQRPSAVPAPQSPTAAELPAQSPKPNTQNPSRGLATHYQYDPLTGALTKTTYPDGTTIEYNYDTSGRLSQVKDPTGTRKFAYNLKGQITSEIVTPAEPINGEPITYRINRSYTNLGQPKSLKLRSLNVKEAPIVLQHDVNYHWTDHNQLAEVSSPAGTFQYGYEESSPTLLTSLTGPALATEYTYEPHRNLLTGVTNHQRKSAPISGPNLAKTPGKNLSPSHLSPSTTAPAVISSYTYANDVLGRRETISQGGTAFAQLKLGTTAIDVAYNDRSEVIGATYRPETADEQSFNYQYDSIGNRTLSTIQSGEEKASYTYRANALNQYESIKSEASQSLRGSAPSGDASLRETSSHDLDGNLLSDSKNTYSWNSENRLTEVLSQDRKTKVTYTYDYQGRRTTKKTFTRSNSSEDFQLKTSNSYIYDGWNLLAEVSILNSSAPDTSPTSNYFTWGRDLSGSLQGAGGVGGLLAISESSTGILPVKSKGKTSETTPATTAHQSTYYPAYDANGNVGQLVDEKGIVAAAYNYDPFGNVTAMAGEKAHDNPWRFSTKPVEEVTGWSYYGFRYYMPQTGRWASRDPINEEGGVNLYGFVGNDGVGGVDVLGKIPNGHLFKKVCCEGKECGIARDWGCCDLGCFRKEDECCKLGLIRTKVVRWEYEGYRSLDACIGENNPLNIDVAGVLGAIPWFGDLGTYLSAAGARDRCRQKICPDREFQAGFWF